MSTTSPARSPKSDNLKPGHVATTGAVLSKEDGRLKENRDKGVALGTTEHSATLKKAKKH